MYQVFEGDPTIISEGYAIGGDRTAEEFAGLRKEWNSESCKSFETENDDGSREEYPRTMAISPPKGVDEESWWGACYRGVNYFCS